MMETKFWLWKNFADGKREYWAFNNLYPCYPDGGDPLVLGEPCGYALLKESTNGRPLCAGCDGTGILINWGAYITCSACEPAPRLPRPDRTMGNLDEARALLSRLVSALHWGSPGPGYYDELTAKARAFLDGIDLDVDPDQFLDYRPRYTGRSWESWNHWCDGEVPFWEMVRRRSLPATLRAVEAMAMLVGGM